MKKYVLVLSLVLLLLVSCATKKTEQEKPVESVETTVIEQLPMPVTATQDLPPASETEQQSESTASEGSASETEVPAAEEVTSSESASSASTEAPATDWGYVFTSPSSTEEEKPQETKSAETLKSDFVKPASAVAAKPASPEAPQEEVVKTSFFTKVAYFIAHETLFSFGLVVCTAGLVYFIVALVKSSGMIEKKKKVQVKEEVVEETPSDQDVEPQDNLSSDFDSEAEKDEFLRALLGENKK